MTRAPAKVATKVASQPRERAVRAAAAAVPMARPTVGSFRAHRRHRPVVRLFR